MSNAPKIVVVGLGYVGLPLAITLAEHGDVIGFDVDDGRIAELKRGHDRTREVDPKRLGATHLRITAASAEGGG